ncbi:hypothetical protein N8I77_009600 [Diaporthe amygdali]|uniref:Heterokaryon incompatibility domain-containing protein n=1 Tax=Phomopsis amygdali TaxID=1214568 RepID=A0AAD9SBD9_PHOAM|nr:hypothetical protein N8I77_009600 [Diaporthe amygdali]
MSFKLSTEEVLKINQKIHTFVLLPANALDTNDADLFVVQPPPHVRDPAHQAPVHSMTHLCDTCRGALEYMSYYLETEAPKEAVEDLHPACLLHDGADTLQQGEVDQCHLCVLIMSDLRTKRLNMGPVARSRIEMCWQSDQKPLARINFALTHGGVNERSTNNYWNFLKLQLWPGSEHGTELFVGCRSGGEEGRNVQRSSSTDSQHTRDVAVEWLSVCQANEDGKHGQCNQDQGDWLPTRLLDVAWAVETGKLRLVLPHDHPEEFVSSKQYMTLSHCWGAWGAVSLPVLTVENLSERQTIGLDTSLLPKTFKEAVEVAQWYNCRWLWIDSLCIIQDSTEDWQREAVMMYNVYKSALLNISADDSNDARWGCFRNRDGLSVMPMRLGFPQHEEWSSWLTPDSTGLFEAITDAPLAKRAWVFQERQLSRRVLHFTSREVVWECCAEGSYFACETFPHGAPYRTIFGERPKYQSQGQKGSVDEIYDTWDMLCQSYSEKKLSFVGDKVVALSGLAQEFQAMLPEDTYVAGMWRSLLPQSLLWRSADASGRIDSDKYIAPSWSWLSIDGPVSSLSSRSTSTPVVEVLEVVTEPMIPSQPTATLREAYLDLRCYLRPVEVKPDHEAKPWHMLAIGGGKNHVLAVGDGGTDLGSFDPMKRNGTFAYSFDVEFAGDAGPKSVSGYFLPVSMDSPNETSSKTINGLLVEPVNDDLTVFRRVGAVTCHGLHCLPILYKTRDVGRVDQESAEYTGRWNELGNLLGPSYKSGESIKKESKLKQPAGESSSVLPEGTDHIRGSDLGKGLEGPRNSNTVSDDADKPNSDAPTAEVHSDRDQTTLRPDENVNDLGKKMEDLSVVEKHELDKPFTKVDLKAFEALERLYALDEAFTGSDLEQHFERMVAKQIRLI